MTSIRNRIKKLRKIKKEKDIPILMKDKSTTMKPKNPEITTKTKCAKESQGKEKETPNYAKKTLIDEAHFNHIQLLTYVNTFVIMVCFIMLSVQFFSKNQITSKARPSITQKEFTANKTLAKAANTNSINSEKNMGTSLTTTSRDPEPDKNPSLSIALPTREIPNNKRTKKKASRDNY